MSFNYDKVVDYGAEEDNYTWTQDKEEVILTVAVPEDTTAKSIAYKLTASTLVMGLVGQEPLINGRLGGIVKVDESVWSLDRETHKVEITLRKAPNTQEYWSSAIQGAKEVDLDLIEGTKYLDASLLAKVKAQKEARKAEEAAAAAAEGGDDAAAAVDADE